MRKEKGTTIRKQEKNGRKWEREREGKNGFHDSCPKKRLYIFKYFELFKWLPNLESFSCRQNILVSKWMIKGNVENFSHCKLSQLLADCETSFLFGVNFLSPHVFTKWTLGFHTTNSSRQLHMLILYMLHSEGCSHWLKTN